MPDEQDYIVQWDCSQLATKGSKRRAKEEKYKQHLKFMYDNVSFYPPPVMYVDQKIVGGGFAQGGRIVLGMWCKVDKPYYKRIYKGSHKNNRYSYYKKLANKTVRRYNKEIANGSGYKKCYDYWWLVD